MSIGEPVTFVVGIIANIAVIYYAHKQNQIFLKQNEIFAAQGGIPVSDSAKMPSFAARYWPTITMGGLALSIWVGIGYDVYDRHNAPIAACLHPLWVKGWGTEQEGGKTLCTARLDGSQVMDWKQAYNLAFACGFTDPKVDRMEDEGISVSHPFTIQPMDVSMAVEYSPQMIAREHLIAANVLKDLPKGYNGPIPGQVWIDVILLPKGIKGLDIHRLSDVTRLGGMLQSQNLPAS